MTQCQKLNLKLQDATTPKNQTLIGCLFHWFNPIILLTLKFVLLFLNIGNKQPKVDLLSQWNNDKVQQFYFERAPMKISIYIYIYMYINPITIINYMYHNPY